MAKRPAYLWYPGDFRRDTAVAACPFDARSLWREMLDLMHFGDPYGHLTAGGYPIAPEELARIVGIPRERCVALLCELETRRVFSRTQGGVIFSRRMVRDEHIRTVRSKAGKQRAGGAERDGAGGFAPAHCPAKSPAQSQQKPRSAVAVAFAVAGNDDGAVAEVVSGFPAVAAWAASSPGRQAILEQLCGRVAVEARPGALPGFIALVNNALVGLDGPQRTAEEVESAITDWCYTAREPSMGHLRGFFRRARPNDKGPDRDGGGGSARRPRSPRPPGSAGAETIQNAFDALGGFGGVA